MKFDGLFKFHISSFDDCVDLPDFPCSFRKNVNAYVFWTKFLVIYYSSIIIGTIYAWHRTVRLISCLLVLFIIAFVVIGTDLVLYCHRIVPTCYIVCGTLVFGFSGLAALMPHILQDPLSILCGHHIPLDRRCEYLQSGTSLNARFYRWMKRIKKQWNIQEEKLIISTAFGIITTMVCIILEDFIIWIKRK